jgi:hypothetical protein
MNNIIPSTVVDGFFNNPYQIRDFGLEATKQGGSNLGKLTYRGERSKCLSVIHPILFSHINRKILSSYFDLNRDNVSWTSEMTYQLTDESYGDGWVHTDHFRKADYSRPPLLTGIIYLTPNAPLECGTSLYRPKSVAAEHLHLDVKNSGNVDPDLRKSEYYDVCRKENNDQFEKIMTVNNLFNRLVIFDSSYLHCADRFFGNTRENSRLTIVIFMTELYVNQTPIARIRSL